MYLLGNICIYFFSHLANWLNERNPAIWLVPGAGGISFPTGLHLASYADDHAINVEITLNPKTAGASCNKKPIMNGFFWRDNYNAYCYVERF